MDDFYQVKSEARSMFALLRQGQLNAAFNCQTVEQLRAEIGCDTPYRRKVLHFFNALVFRSLPAATKAKYKAKVAALLVQGWSYKAVRAMVPVSLRFIRTVSTESHACAFGPPRRGRKFTEEQKEQLRAAVKEGKRRSEIAREFRVSLWTAGKARRALGYSGRVYQRKFSEQQIAEAMEAVKRGEAWRTAAKQFRIATVTLLRRSDYRKRVSAVKSRPEWRSRRKRAPHVHGALFAQIGRDS